MSRKIFKINKKKCSHKKNVYKMKHKSKKAKKRVSRRRMKIIGGEGEGKNILLIIDPQNDFMDIEGSSLPVQGASKDMERLIGLLNIKSDFFDEIHVSLDSHTKNHIGHKGFWDPNLSPNAFEIFFVNKDDNEFKIYVKRDGSNEEIKTKIPELQLWAYHYILKMYEPAVDINVREKLYKPTKPLPCLWPDHCIIQNERNINEEGWNVYKELKNKLDKIPEKVFYHEKGTNDLVEMYSIFSAEIPFEDLLNDIDYKGLNNDKYRETYTYISQTKYPSTIVTSIENIGINSQPNKPNDKRNYNTEFNSKLFTDLIGKNNNNKIYVCGEAKTHCVKTSIEDMIKNSISYKYDINNIYLIKDCTSPIVLPGIEDPENKLQEIGIQITTSEELMNNNNNTDTSVENPKI